MKRLLATVGVTAATVLALTSCNSGSNQSAPASGSAAVSQAAGSGTLVVFAAASLQQTFDKLGAQFHAEHPAITVKFSYGGSSGLVTQLGQGAPADVFASADTANMDKATSQHLVSGTPVDFARNTLTIVTAPGNPKGIKTFRDLDRQGVSVVVCAQPVPCGSATEKVEKTTGVTLHPVSEEDDVTSVLTKVRTGQADAGLVYTTDAKGAGSAVTAVNFPEAGKAVNTYPIATLAGAKNPTAAKEFVAFITGTEGQAALAAAGFAKP
ncbi:molybdate ABC transporter substrate-binding protein [Tsukamurella soli]|uniref:Molybdate ABC transporter substrate-binding protein n=1 Tax=Tsukamurella soli TaxID=644556 RepID=A0ABP8KAY0_9ACTN